MFFVWFSRTNIPLRWFSRKFHSVTSQASFQNKNSKPSPLKTQNIPSHGRPFILKSEKLNKQGTQLTNLLPPFRITTSSKPIQSMQTYCSVITLHPAEHPEDISFQLLSSSGPQDLIRWIQILHCKEGCFLSALLR